MKRNITFRAGALTLALAMAAVLAGCSQEDSSASTSETATGDTAADQTSTSESATDETADPYAYLADFSYSDAFDENGYLTGVTALDYVTLPDDYNAMTLPAGTDEVTDEDVDNYIDQNILSGYATQEQVTDRAAEMGDSVNIDFVGSVDGEEFDGGSAQGYDITLGSGSFIDDFEDQIAGHTPGETFDVNVTFPDPYQNNPDLAGKEAVFVTTLNYINETVLPELTDEWVQENINQYFGLKTVEDLREHVRSQMVFSSMSNAVYQQLMDNSTFQEAPAEVTKFFEDCYLYSAYTYAQNYGMTLNDMLSAMGYGDASELLETGASTVESMARQTLLMQAVAEKEGVVCDDAALAENINDYFSTATPESYVEGYGENYVKTNVLQDMLMHQLVDNATVAAE